MIAMHQFQKLWQLQNFNMTLCYLQRGQVLFVHDFQMNLMLFTQDEPAGTHWDHPQITFHPTSAFFHCLNTKCNKIVCEDIIHISDVLRHDKHAVNTFVMKSIDHLKGKGVPIQEIIKFTDQASGQYKSKFTFYAIMKFDVPYTRHFYGVKHGKGPSDRSGGWFKKSMRNAVNSKEVLLNARQIEDYCRREYFQQNACKEHNETNKSDNGSDELCNEFSGDKKDPHIQCIVYDHAVIERQPDECIKGISGSRDWIHMVWNTGVERVVQHKFFDCCCFGCITHSAPCNQGYYSDVWITASIKGKHDLNNINAEEWFKSIAKENTQNDVLNFKQFDAEEEDNDKCNEVVDVQNCDDADKIEDAGDYQAHEVFLENENDEPVVYLDNFAVNSNGQDGNVCDGVCNEVCDVMGDEISSREEDDVLEVMVEDYVSSDCSEESEVEYEEDVIPPSLDEDDPSINFQ